MGAEWTGPEHDPVPPLRAAKDSLRRAHFIDIVDGPKGTPDSGRYEQEFMLPPYKVLEHFKGTAIAELLPQPDDLPVEVLMYDLGPPGDFWTPKAGPSPDQALLRRSLTHPVPGGDIMRWRRSLGAVFQSHYGYGERVVTADFEVGIVLSGGSGFNLFSRGSILVNGAILAVSIPEYFPVKVGVVDEFLASIDSLRQPPAYKQAFKRF